MTIKEYKTKSEKELQNLLAESRDKLRDMKFKVSQNQLKNIRQVREVKKTIAQILTILNSKKNRSS